MKEGAFRNRTEDILNALYPDRDVPEIVHRLVGTVAPYQRHPLILAKRKKIR